MYGFEVLRGGRVIGRLNARRHAFVFVKEALGKFARGVVLVPVPAVGQLQAFGRCQPEAVHVVDEYQHAGHFHGFGDAEFLCGFHGIDGVASSIRERQDLRLGRLCLQQERRKVRGIQWMAYSACYRAAVGLDDAGCIAFEGVTKSVVSRQEKPAFVARLDQCGTGDFCQRHRVVGVMDGVRRAVFIRQTGRAGTDGDEGPFLFGGDLGHRQCRAGVGAAYQHGQTVLVNPFTRFRRGHVRLVLVIGAEHFNRTVEHLAAEILRCPADHFGTGGAVDVGVQARHVGDDADFHRTRGLRQSGCTGDGAQAQSHCGHQWFKCFEFHENSLLKALKT